MSSILSIYSILGTYWLSNAFISSEYYTWLKRSSSEFQLWVLRLVVEQRDSSMTEDYVLIYSSYHIGKRALGRSMDQRRESRDSPDRRQCGAGRPSLLIRSKTRSIHNCD